MKQITRKELYTQVWSNADKNLGSQLWAVRCWAGKNPGFKGFHFSHSRFEYVRVPSGRLCLTIYDIRDHSAYDIRRNWRDTATKKLNTS